ncbi:MAG: hypothetical protein ACAI25_17745, partial [Planctomycetota bacterium]
MEVGVHLPPDIRSEVKTAFETLVEEGKFFFRFLPSASKDSALRFTPLPVKFIGALAYAPFRV